MPKILKYLLIIVCITLLPACSYVVNEDIHDNMDTDQSNMQTFKICEEKYFNYINTTAKLTVDNSNYFDRFDIRNRYPYIIIAYYPNKMIGKKDFDGEVINIYRMVYEELSKNSYSSKCGLKYSYEYINIEFYNFDNKKDNGPSYQTYKQINVLEISKYDDFEKYNSRGEK